MSCRVHRVAPRATILHDDASIYNVYPHILAAVRAKTTQVAPSDATFAFYEADLTFRDEHRMAAFDELIRFARAHPALPVVTVQFRIHERHLRPMPANVHVLSEMMGRHQEHIVPFVTRPITLDPAPPTARRTFLLVGHVPKVYINPTRFDLLRQLIDHPSATVHSHTLAQHWQYHSCDNQSFVPRRGKCKPYRQRNFTQFARAHASLFTAPPKKLSHRDYLALAANHTACLVACGDYPSTQKIGESLAVFAQGGCLPVLVRIAESAIPHVQAYRKCVVATESVDVALIEARIASLDAPTLARMRARAAALAPKFIYGGASPDAAETVVRDLCDRFKQMGNKTEATQRGNHRPH